jgi:hypothetical protein
MTPEEFTSPVITKDIEMIILNMVNIIKEVSAYNTNLSSMTLYFKVDDHQRIWFMYCSRISIRTNFKDPWFKDLFRSAAGTREDSPVLRYATFDPILEVEELEKKLQMKSDSKTSVFVPNSDQQNCSMCLSELS